MEQCSCFRVPTTLVLSRRTKLVQEEGNSGTMSLLQSGPPMGGAPTREVIVKAERIGLPPRPWTWAIYEADGQEALHRSSRTYRSAEDAWTMGHTVYGLLGQHGWRKP